MNIRLLCLVPLIAITSTYTQKAALKITDVEISSGHKGAPTPTVSIRFTFDNIKQDSTLGSIIPAQSSRTKETYLINLTTSPMARTLRKSLGLSKDIKELGVAHGYTVAVPYHLLYENALASVAIPPKEAVGLGGNPAIIFCNGPCKLRPQYLYKDDPSTPEAGQEQLVQIQTGDVPHEEFQSAQQ